MDNFTRLCRARERRITKADARVLLDGLREIQEGVSGLVDSAERVVTSDAGARAAMAVRVCTFLNTLLEFGLIVTTETETTEEVATP